MADWATRLWGRVESDFKSVAIDLLTPASRAVGFVERKLTPRNDVVVIADGDGPGNDHLTKLDIDGAASGSVLIINPKDTGSMVADAIKAANGRPLRSLTIKAHGNVGLQKLGNNVLALARSDGGIDFDPRLSQLAQIVDDKTVVKLSGCHAGQGDRGETLVRDLARLWKTEVRAGDEVQYSSPYIDGSVIDCRPLGRNTNEVQCVRASDEVMLPFVR
jgi:hypothetical protein